MERKRKRVVLTINQKLNIIKKLEQGGSIRNVALQYGIGETTVRDLRKNKDKLINYASSNSDSLSGDLSGRKTMKPSTYDELDKAMLQWFNQQRTQNIPVTGIICAKQANLYFNALGMEGDFNASSGWLTRFKQRHGIREISINGGGKLTNNETTAVNEFRNDFQQFIDEQQVTLEQIYNADETGLNWKCLPTKTLAHKSESRAPKSSIERITVLCCANATGSHKIKLAVIGKAKKPRSFKGTENMPVTYFSQKKAWMDNMIFKTWFHHNFVPQVREHLRSKGLPEKAILLLDHAPSHPNETVLQSADGKIVTRSLPPNVTARIQPMDQGVTSVMKRIYRGRLLQKLVEEGNDLKAFSNAVSLLDAMYEIAHAWDSIKPSTISQSWKKIFPDIENINCNSDDEEEISPAELVAIIQSTEGGVDVDRGNILEWFEVDCDDVGCEVMSDSEIIKRAQGQTTDSDESEDENMELIPETRISNSSALEWTEGLLKYLEQQSDSLLSDKLVLRRLRASIRKKVSLKHS